MHATLPFCWLRDVWAPRLAVVLGQFARAATRAADGAVELLVAEPAPQQPHTIRLTT